MSNLGTEEILKATERLCGCMGLLVPEPAAPPGPPTEVSGTDPAAAAQGGNGHGVAAAASDGERGRLALSTRLGRPGNRRWGDHVRGCWSQGLPWEGLAWGAAARAPFQPGQVRLEGLHVHFRSAVWASGGLGRGAGIRTGLVPSWTGFP